MATPPKHPERYKEKCTRCGNGIKPEHIRIDEHNHLMYGSNCHEGLQFRVSRIAKVSESNNLEMMETTCVSCSREIKIPKGQPQCGLGMMSAMGQSTCCFCCEHSRAKYKGKPCPFESKNGLTVGITS